MKERIIMVDAAISAFLFVVGIFIGYGLCSVYHSNREIDRLKRNTISNKIKEAIDCYDEQLLMILVRKYRDFIIKAIEEKEKRR